MAATPLPFNPYNPVCTLDACLNQVAGYLDNNPLGQYASCTSLYGVPVVSTATASAEIVFETITSTLSYVDVTVEFTTTESTVQETSTSYNTLLETVTAYTTTVVSTITETAAATATWNGGATPQKRHLDKQDKRKHRRRGCKPRSSVLSFSTPAPSSTDPVTSSLATESGSAVPCTDSAQHFSACSCIDAVSTVSLITEPATTLTSTVHETRSTTSTSTSTSTITVAITTVVVQPAATTLTSTLLTGKATTTTTTSTSTSYIINPTQTAAWAVVSPAALQGRRTVVSGSPAAMAIGDAASAGSSMVFTVGAGSQPRLASNTNLRLYLQNNSSVRTRFIFVTAGTASSAGHIAVTCDVNGSSGLVSCLAQARGWTRMIQCGNEVYMSSPTYVNAACTEVQFKISPWVD